MKQLILTGLFIMAFFSFHAQGITDSLINKVDKQGRKQGKWRVFDEDLNLKYTGEYINGKPIGTFTYYYTTGKIKAVVNQLDSGKITYARNYFPNGTLMAEGKYVNQKKDSTWLYYNEEDGALSAEEHYVGSLKEGVWKTYYPEGKVAEEVIYRNDMKEGPWTQFFTDGTVKMKASYISNKLEGPCVFYYLDGTVEVSGSYLDNEKNGTWIYFGDKGEVIKQEEYQKGILLKPDKNKF